MQGTSGKPPACVGVRQLCRKGTHSGCMTRRLRRERWGCRPEGGSTFFRCERKYQRKPAARRLREKGFYCPFWRRGSQCRAQWSWTAFTNVWSALVLAFFRRQNGRAFFPPLPIAALLPHSWRRAHLNSASWDASKYPKQRWLSGHSAKRRRKNQYCFLCCEAIQAAMQHPNSHWLSLPSANCGRAERR